VADVTIRDLGDEVLAHVRERAQRRHRSLEAERRDIITRSVEPVDIDAFKVAAAEIRARTAGRRQSDSTDLIREDRDR
jgi:plasmid stability protein